MDVLVRNTTLQILHYAGISVNEGPSFLKGFLTGADGDDFRVIQPVWDMIMRWETYIVSPLFPVFLSVSFFFFSMVPWMIFDLYGQDWKWIQRYKIQPEYEVTWPGMRKAMLLTIWNHLLYIMPITIAQFVWTDDTPLPKEAPGLWEFCWQQYAALAIFDFEYYVWHYTHHQFRFLYKHIHGIHHQFHAPHSWVTQYLHPWELISVGIFTTTSPWWFNSHPMTQWSFMLFSIAISVEAHIGYDLPMLPHHWMPFWGGGIKHDMHHQKPLSNYQPFFNWFDRLFSTEAPGQMAGGYKPQELMEYEKRSRDAMDKRLAAKRQLADIKTLKQDISVPN